MRRGRGEQKSEGGTEGGKEWREREKDTEGGRRDGMDGREGWKEG